MKRCLRCILFAALFAPTCARSLAADTTVVLGGREWVVKESQSPVGPGPNFFSARAIADTESGLALSVVSRRTFGVEREYAGEMYTRDYFGYGAFELDFATGGPLDSAVVFGFFLYNNDYPPHFGEVDFEIARWDLPDADDGQFSVQPYDASGNSVTFRMPNEPLEYTVRIEWGPDRVEMLLATRDGTEIRRWTYAGESMPLMETPGERVRVHINLWLFRGMSPAGDGERSVEVTDFRFSRAG